MKIRLIIPNVGHDPEHKTYLSAIADIAGGFTAWQATGGWKDDNRRVDSNGDDDEWGEPALVVEPVTVIECGLDVEPDIFPKLAARKRENFRALARTIAGDLDQTCVYLEIDGRVEYVTPAKDNRKDIGPDFF